MNIGNKIKQLRQRAGMTQEQLAGRVGVSAQSVSKWENQISMPDIVLLPILAEEFGVSVDELFDLTVESKLRRIDSRIEKSEEISADVFGEYEEFLLCEAENESNKYKAVSLLAQLYHHRMEEDARRVSKYSREAIMMCPEKKDCQWLLNMAEGQSAWDWNVGNHSSSIDFYKEVIKNDKLEPQTPMPYYYLIDNLIADNRTEEARAYLSKLEKLPAHNPILIPTYKAHIALGEHNLAESEAAIAAGMVEFSENGGYLFEVAQYYAARADYKKALEFYESYWELEGKSGKPRFTDALEGIATIYSIMGNKQKLLETYDRTIKTLKEEWNYSEDDLPVLEILNKKIKLMCE